MKSNQNNLQIKQNGDCAQSTYKSKDEMFNNCFDIKIPALKDNNYFDWNIVFLPDGSFTVGNKVGVPNIYIDSNINSRYGYIVSNNIESEHYFKKIIVKVDKIESVNGNVIIEFRGKDCSEVYTEWFEVEENKNNEIVFLPLNQYKFLQYRVSIITNHLKNVPVVKSISVKACK